MLALTHDSPPPLTHELAQPSRPADKYHARRPPIAGRSPSPGHIGDSFSHWWLAEHVEHAGSRFAYQVDVLDSDWAGARRSGDVESCLHESAAVPVRCASGRRSAQASNSDSVVVGRWRAGMDGQIQSGSGSSESGIARRLPNRSRISYTPYASGKRYLSVQPSSPKVIASL
jgi:hypothetical protein